MVTCISSGIIFHIVKDVGIRQMFFPRTVPACHSFLTERKQHYFFHQELKLVLFC
uniref:Uncharacterized protein n=1 Tax=Salix viminalis TaxID=40686 RepID=A0A6N2MM11_SALVM